VEDVRISPIGRTESITDLVERRRVLDLVLQVDLIYSPVVWWTTRMYNYPAEFVDVVAYSIPVSVHSTIALISL
jgi:hypothetical protein